MKPLILISILLEGGLLGLIIPRIHRRDPGIAIFLISDILLLLALFYGLVHYYPLLSYLSMLFLYVYCLSLQDLSDELTTYHSLLRYISLGILAIAPMLISLFILPEEYHSIPVAVGMVVSLFSFLNLTLLLKGWHLSIYDRIMLYTLYIKLPVLVIALSTPIYYPTPEIDSGQAFKNLLFLQPLSSFLLILSGYGVLFKGRLFRFKVRPSPELLWKSLLLIAIIVYGVLLTYLDRYPLEKVIPFYSRVILISAFAILSTVILLSRKARLSVRSFLFRHLYSSRYDLHEVLKQTFTLVERSEGSIPYFAKGVVRYLFERHPFSGISLEVSTPDEDVKESAGMTESPVPDSNQGTIPHLIFADEVGPSKTTITFFNRNGFDEDDRLNLRLISELIFRITSEMRLSRERVFKEKLMVADRLKLFILHDLKNICQTLKMLEKNILKVPQSKAEEFFDDLCSTLPHLVRRAEKILKRMGTDFKSVSSRLKGMTGSMPTGRG